MTALSILLGGGVVVFLVLWGWSRATGYQRARDEVEILRQLNERKDAALRVQREARIARNQGEHATDVETIGRIRSAADAARELRGRSTPPASGTNSPLPGNGTPSRTKPESQ